MERVLDREEKPLEIVLDCSTKGLASPKFIYQPGGSPFTSHHTNHFTAHLTSLETSSFPNIPAASYASSSSPTGSPHLPTSHGHQQWLSVDRELQSVNSLSSIPSPKNYLKAPRSAKSMTLVHSRSPPQKKKLCHTLSDQGIHSRFGDGAAKHLQPTPLVNSLTASPNGKRKISVGSFFTRSLRATQKLKNSKDKSPKSSRGVVREDLTASLDSTDMPHAMRLASTKGSSLISPLPTQRNFTMSSIMHIYFTDARKAQIYKSVLVSQKATTGEVISQALERFSMAFQDPRNFRLFEVVGHWQDVSKSLQMEEDVNRTASLSNLSVASGLLTQHTAITSVEEFVVCYSRELGPNESPYTLQFYFTPQEGYSRRFELRHCTQHSNNRSKSLSVEAGEQSERKMELLPPKKLSWARSEYRSDSPLFGDTSHHKRGRGNNPPAPLPRRVMQESPETEEVSVMRRGSGSGTNILQQRNGIREDRRGSTDSRQDAHRSKEEMKDGSDIILLERQQDSPPQMRGHLLSTASSSSDSGVINFLKEQGDDRHLYHQDSVLSSGSYDHLQPQILISTTEEREVAAGNRVQSTLSLQMAILVCLRLHDPGRELLMQPLQAAVINITAGNIDPVPTGPDASSVQNILLRHPDLSAFPHPLCSIQRCQGVGTNLSFPSVAEPAAEPVHTKYLLHFHQPGLLVCINGQPVQVPTVLHHGDLLSVGQNNLYLFLFQDYTSPGKDQQLQAMAYGWKPYPSDDTVLLPCTSTPHSSTPHTSTPHSSPLRHAASTKCSTTERVGGAVKMGSGYSEGVKVRGGDGEAKEEEIFQSVSGGLERGRSKEVSLDKADKKQPNEREIAETFQTPTLPSSLQLDSFPEVAENPHTMLTSRQSSTSSLCDPNSLWESPYHRPSALQERGLSRNGCHIVGENLMTSFESLSGKRPGTPSKSSLQLDECSPKHASLKHGSLKRGSLKHGSSKHGLSKHSKHRHHSSSSSSLSTPTSSPLRKTLFSFSLSEEPALLQSLITNLSPVPGACHLGPALILAMCTEYCLKCHGPAATTRFLQRTVDSLQEVVWVSVPRVEHFIYICVTALNMCSSLVLAFCVPIPFLG